MVDAIIDNERVFSGITMPKMEKLTVCVESAVPISNAKVTEIALFVSVESGVKRAADGDGVSPKVEVKVNHIIIVSLSY